MLDDAALLRRYATEKSETAFAELVARHIDVVYSAALRQLGGDTHQAQDVSQIVFATLARRASSLIVHPVLAGWLYTTTRHVAQRARRAAQRRRAREEEAARMNVADEGTTEWARIRPVLDDAMRELGERDREALLLRFFARRPFAEIGRAMSQPEQSEGDPSVRPLEGSSANKLDLAAGLHPQQGVRNATRPTSFWTNARGFACTYISLNSTQTAGPERRTPWSVSASVRRGWRMLQCFQLRPEAGERGVIGAEAFEFGGRDLLREQPAILIAQARKLVGVGLRVHERDMQLHRLSPLHRQRSAAGDHQCDEHDGEYEGRARLHLRWHL